MAENPYISGQFYEGEYATARPAFTFRDATKGERPAFLVEIEGSKETDAFVLKKVRFAGPTWTYYVRADGVRIKSDTGPNIAMSQGQTLWYRTRYDHPAFLVFTLDDGTLRYASFDTDVDGNFRVFSTPPGNNPPS